MTYKVQRNVPYLLIVAGSRFRDSILSLAPLYSVLASFLSRLFLHVVASISTRSSMLYASYLLKPQWERFFFPESPSKSSGDDAHVPGLAHMQISAPGTGKRVLVLCSDWPEVSHVPTPGIAGGVSSTQASWVENEGGVAPQRKLRGRRNRNKAGGDTQSGLLGPGPRI